MHVAAIRLEVHDGIADDLAGAVIGDVAAAAGLVDLDAARVQHLGRREDVRASAVAADTERQHVRMLDEQQQVADAVRSPILDERALDLERVRVRYDAESSDFEGTHVAADLTAVALAEAVRLARDPNSRARA